MIGSGNRHRRQCPDAGSGNRGSSRAIGLTADPIIEGKNGTVRSVLNLEWPVHTVWRSGPEDAPPLVPSWLVLPKLLPSVRRGPAGFRGGHTNGSRGTHAGSWRTKEGWWGPHPNDP